jgi:ribonuclease-3
VESPDLIAARRAAVAAATGHTMGDDALLAQAATHLSLLGAQAGVRRNREANERLEFLGDAVLGAAIVHLLYRRLPDMDEGWLTRLKSRLVSREQLARVIEAAGLLPHCRVGAQMGADPATWPDSLKANLMEAILGAIFLDGGWPALSTAVDRLWSDRIEAPEMAVQDVRQRLQEVCHRLHGALPTYAAERSGGTDHQPEFTATVAIAGQSATGTGIGRRRAESAAAAALLAMLEPSAPV